MNRQAFSLSNICAHCEHWYIGRDKDLVSPEGDPACASPGPCTGVLGRQGYPHYKGPLDLEFLATHCAWCGENAPQHVRTSDGRRIGYCERHLGEIKMIAAQMLERR